MTPVDIISAVGFPIALMLGLGWFMVFKIWPSFQEYLIRVHRSLDRRDAALENLVKQFTDLVADFQDLRTGQEAILSVVVQLEEAQDKASQDRSDINDSLFSLAQAINNLRKERRPNGN